MRPASIRRFASKMYTETFEGGWNGSSCSMYRVWTTGSAKAFGVPNFFTKVRAAMQAWTWLAGGTRVDYKLIDARVSQGPA